MIDEFIRIQMKPALPTLIRGPGIPGNTECLNTSVRKLDQVLLQRLYAERVGNLEISEFAIRPVGLNEILAVTFEKTRLHIAIGI